MVREDSGCALKMVRQCKHTGSCWRSALLISNMFPSNLANLPAEFLSHSARHREVEPFRGRSVVVIGGGASALDLAGLLHEAGADVQLVGRRKRELKFH